MNLSIALLTIFLFIGGTLAQENKKTDKWEKFKFFIGSWEGTGEGVSGKSTVEREYSFILNSKYIKSVSKSVYEPQEKNPKGEIHEETGMISFDTKRKKFVFRQFHIEGFVNQYTSESISDDGKTIVFVTESIENIPEGWRARETYKILNDNEFQETFELSEPGKEFEIYSQSNLKRK
jgi:hypothetical protein